MVVFRGGGYRIHNGSGEGCAQYFADRGVLGVEVEYRTVEGPGDCAEGPGIFPKPFHDVARAVRLVRSMATELGVDPNRIGVTGFSAGGHLAAMLCGGENLPCQEAMEDDLSHLSFRPDVCVLGYPVISFLPEMLDGTGVLESCRDNLGCPSGEEESVSAQLRVTQGHPPVFIWHTKADKSISAWHSELYAQALKEKGVPHKLLLFEDGPHALGLALEGEFANDWGSQMLSWLGAWVQPRLSVPAPEL